MIIKLDSGKELTLEEVKEIIDRFQGLLGDKEKEPTPYPIYIERQITPIGPYYYGPITTCKAI